jgi:hypothetical protein
VTRKNKQPTFEATPTGFGWQLFLALIFGALVLFVLGTVAPGALRLGARTVCPRETATIVIEQRHSSFYTSGRQRGGSSYRLWCLDQEGIGAPRDTTTAWIVLYGWSVLAASAGLFVYRLSQRARAKKARA